VVRPSEVQGRSLIHGGSGQLGHCLYRILLSSAGQSDRPRPVQRSAAQLKTIQEVITLVVFSIFSVVYLKEALKWNYVVGFALIVVAVFVIFKEW
jgi:uncharacterized protein (DUF486 family)